jgi:hypothetical protein
VVDHPHDQVAERPGGLPQQLERLGLGAHGHLRPRLARHPDERLGDRARVVALGGLRGMRPIADGVVVHTGVSMEPGWTMDTVTGERSACSSTRRVCRKPRSAHLAAA